jgi:fucose permease
LAVQLLSYLAFLALGVPDGMAGILWPSLRTTFERPQSSFGVVLVGAGGGYFAAGLTAAGLIGRWGIGGLLARAMALLAAGVVVQAGAPLWPALVLGAAMAGFGSGAVDTGLNAHAALAFSPRRINWLHGCYSLGATAAPLVAALALARGSSWRLIDAATGAFLLVLATAFAATRGRWSGPAGPVSDGGPSKGRDRAGWHAAAQHRLVWLQAALFFCYTGLEMTLGQWGYTVLHEERGVTAALAGVWISLYWGGIAAGRFALGAVVARVGADRMLRCCTIAALVGAGLFAADLPSVSTPGLVLAGLALAPVFPTLIARGPERVGTAIATHAVGIKVAAGMLGSTAIPAAAGLTVTWFGLGAIGWVGAASAVLVLALHECLLACTPESPLAAPTGSR